MFSWVTTSPGKGLACFPLPSPGTWSLCQHSATSAHVSLEAQLLGACDLLHQLQCSAFSQAFLRCPSFISVAMTKTVTKGIVGKEWVCLAYIPQSHFSTEGVRAGTKSSNLEARTEAETVQENSCSPGWISSICLNTTHDPCPRGGSTPELARPSNMNH